MYWMTQVLRHFTQVHAVDRFAGPSWSYGRRVYNGQVIHKLAFSADARSRVLIWTITMTAALAAGCATNARRAVPPGTAQPDQFLFNRGTSELKEKHWLTAREFFKQVTETYTQSPLRPEAKLAVGDTYLGENTPESLVLGINEFQEFLAFYPTNPRADYAQFQLGMAHFKQMRAPERDQTETRNAVREFETFVNRYPASSLLLDGKAKLREARDRLSQSEFLVGRFYYRINWYPGAIERLRGLIKQDPEFTGRDGVYFYLGESYIKQTQPAEALPWFEKLIEEFQVSEHLEEARKRITVLKTQAQGKQTS
jgi:outer membrane protein assembly factor BamD